jgi:cysteine desulfurase
MLTYLDANATEPLRPEARDAVIRALDSLGNPASIHLAGRTARALLEDARETIATRFGARPADVVLTSGGTEANAIAVNGLGRDRRIIIGATEHDAVRAAAPGAITLAVDGDGVTDLDRLAALLPAGAPALVCVMLANNETGTIQPIARIAELCRAHGAFLHVDAVQAGGRMAVNLAGLGAHAVALSSHKLGGPTGAGALLLAPTVSAIAPLVRGGGQERGRRGGTPALAAIAGFAAAARAGGNAATLEPLRDKIERVAVAHGAVVCGAGAPRLGNTSCLALPGVAADAQVIALDLAGFAVSAGAACSSGKIAASHVLAAMGLGPLAAQAIRISLPWNATEAGAEAAAAAYAGMADRLRLAVAPDGA